MKKKMTYAEKKLQDAVRFYKKMIEKSNLYVPTDGWLSIERAKDANEAWQTMMKSIQTILRILAMEKRRVYGYKENKT